MCCKTNLIKFGHVKLLNSESNKQDTILLPITLPHVDRFLNPFTSGLSSKHNNEVITKISPHLKQVAKLACENVYDRKLALI